MSRWADPRVRDLAISSWGTPKAARRALRQIKRSEAAIRAAATPPEKRRQNRLQREDRRHA